ncbi:NAD-dependent epimerase/dehydratase family protein [Halalkalibacterium ligniniphilum]|uniref:NAD-dependent epimerase/dehydratase family protein n=1 Tax=Halalkalibacterium ligniniphilum TaxID=1134413 RepID=UPI00034AC619|nr:NAD-dependent epimerase/dehydratase family protein [Halalkalibacterium ligniniphilum]
MERVLVTGGCGFIGSHIVDKLIEKGYEVGVVDNLSTGKLENITDKNVSFYDCDIVTHELQDVVADFDPAFIIHQAAQASVPVSINDILLDADVNIRGSINLIDAARKNNVEKIVFASSAAVYGEPKYLPIDENHPINPQSPYGLSKHTIEQYLKMANHLYDIDYTILRYSNVYGPRQDAKGEGGVVAIFADKLSRGENPIIYGDGKQTRDFVYVEDVAVANVAALHSGSKKVLNISCSTKITIKELLNKMTDLAETDIEAIYEKEREGDIRSSILENAETIKQLQWAPKTSIQLGLEQLMGKVLIQS